jgi:hypothetical protein
MIKQLISLRVCLNFGATNAFEELERWTEYMLNIENWVDSIQDEDKPLKC